MRLRDFLKKFDNQLYVFTSTVGFLYLIYLVYYKCPASMLACNTINCFMFILVVVILDTWVAALRLYDRKRWEKQGLSHVVFCIKHTFLRTGSIWAYIIFWVSCTLYFTYYEDPFRRGSYAIPNFHIYQIFLTPLWIYWFLFRPNPWLINKIGLDVQLYAGICLYFMTLGAVLILRVCEVRDLTPRHEWYYFRGMILLLILWLLLEAIPSYETLRPKRQMGLEHRLRVMRITIWLHIFMILYYYKSALMALLLLPYYWRGLQDSLERIIGLFKSGFDFIGILVKIKKQIKKQIRAYILYTPKLQHAVLILGEYVFFFLRIRKYKWIIIGEKAKTPHSRGHLQTLKTIWMSTAFVPFNWDNWGDSERAMIVATLRSNELDTYVEYLCDGADTWDTTMFQFLYYDLFCTYIASPILKSCKNFKHNTYKLNRLKVLKREQLNNKFYLFDYKKILYCIKQLALCGLKSAWRQLRFWSIPGTIFFIFLYYSFFLKLLPFSKFFFGHIMVGNMLYLLFSGFVFFLKKYRYRLYTSIIQRFWRRSLILFWLIEASTLVCFVYLMFNTSQEPYYMYDNTQLYKTHLFSWRSFVPKMLLSAILVILTYILLLSTKWNTFSKTNSLLAAITSILFYLTWLEFYQFFHLMGFYGRTDWLYDFSSHIWEVDLEFKRTRILNHYVAISLIAKFWHIIFTTLFWIFFLIRGFESSRYRYPLLVANLQNFIMIYFLGWLYMYPWFKFVSRKVLDIPFFWFLLNNRKFGLFIFYNDIKLYYFGLSDLIKDTLGPKLTYNHIAFHYWQQPTYFWGNYCYRKHNIRHLFIRNLG